MDAQTILMYTEFFQTSRDYLIHLQSLMVLLLTACAYMYFKAKNKMIRHGVSLAFVLGLLNLMVGLCAFSKLLSTILDLRSNPKAADIMQIGNYIWWQFLIGIVALILFLLCALKRKNE